MARPAHPEDANDGIAAIAGWNAIADDGVTSVRWSGEKPLGEATLGAVEPVQVSRKQKQDVGRVSPPRLGDMPEAPLDLGGAEERERAVERMLRLVDLASGQRAAEPVVSRRGGGLDP